MFSFGCYWISSILLLTNQEAAGSNPAGRTRKFKDLGALGLVKIPGPFYMRNLKR